MSDHRLHQRVEKSLQLVLVYAGREHSVVTRNLSMGGLFVVMDDPPPIGTKVTLRVLLPSLKEESRIACTVRWIGDEGAGLRFDGLRAIEVWALNNLLNDE